MSKKLRFLIVWATLALVGLGVLHLPESLLRILASLAF